MPSINDLNLTDEESQEVAPEEQPRQISGVRVPLPKPGTHRFRLPNDLSQAWDTVSGDKGQRVRVTFEDESALLVEDLADQPFRTNITSIERARDKAKTKFVSDMSYLLVALGDLSGPKKSSDFIKALSSHTGETFKADVEWEAFCNPANDIYREEDGKLSKVEGQKGCGQQYRMREYTTGKGEQVVGIPRHEDGSWAETFECGTEGCGASLRCRGGLSNFRSAK